jgi:hypothetical protein
MASKKAGVPGISSPNPNPMRRTPQKYVELIEPYQTRPMRGDLDKYIHASVHSVIVLYVYSQTRSSKNPSTSRHANMQTERKPISASKSNLTPLATKILRARVHTTKPIKQTGECQGV